jgi:predicted dehydrogenase
MSAKRLGLGVIGCGVIGARRARMAHGLADVVAVFDPDLPRATAIAKESGARACQSTTDLLADPAVDGVIVATPNRWLAEHAAAAIRRGKHVLVEKPVGRSAAEIEHLLHLLEERPEVRVKAGFNLRVHPAIRRAREIVRREDLGRVMYLRGRYGHGGRLGYEREWRADPEQSGGGELIDQGVHLIDLARVFLGDVRLAASITATYFWDMPVDDNSFLLLESEAGAVAHCHVSCTEWKNLFSLEIFFERAKLQIEGLGGSYGTETLTVYRMQPEMGPPPVEVERFEGDPSWREELGSWIAAIERGAPLDGDLRDALAALRIVEDAYRAGIRRRVRDKEDRNEPGAQRRE